MARRKITPLQITIRERYEAELSALPPIPPEVRRFLSPKGFIEYYLVMRDLYPSYEDCYERLEEFCIAITGRRKYSEFDSFRYAMKVKKR